MFKDISIKEYDPALSAAMEAESVRQENHIELIASENFVSKQVMEAAGSVLTNKYAEGLPGKRYYGGCEVVDEIENIAMYERFLQQELPKDVRQVFESLKNASENHLRAFRRFSEN